MKKLGHSTVEPVLGTLINFMGLRRIWTRGTANANKFMLGAAIAYNLKKWLNYDQKKRKTVIMSLKKGLNDLKARGVEDILIACTDNLKVFTDGACQSKIGATYSISS